MNQASYPSQTQSETVAIQEVSFSLVGKGQEHNILKDNC